MASESASASRAYGIVAWGLLVLGVAHIALTPLAYGNLTVDALWFGGTGVAVALAGVLNLCVRAGLTGPGARPLVMTCVAANLVLAALATAFSVLTRGREPQGPLLAGLFVAAGVLCSLRSSPRDPRR
jgi:hypothetical protein